MHNKNTNQVIDYFDGTEYDFLSNFHRSPIVVDGIFYPTVEHAFQAAKTNIHNEKCAIIAASTPGEAKSLGRRCTLRSDWEAIKYNVMTKFVTAKFTQNPELEYKLLKTGKAILIEGNNWGDTTWGVYRGVGKNALGKILMTVRSELKRGGK